MPPLEITALFAAIGLFLLWLAQPLIRREVGPNGLYGFRVPATLADETLWYAVNAHAGRDLRTLGLLLLGGAVLLPWGLGDLAGRLLVGLLLGGLVLVYFRGHRFAYRLVREQVSALAADAARPPAGGGAA